MPLPHTHPALSLRLLTAAEPADRLAVALMLSEAADLADVVTLTPPADGLRAACYVGAPALDLLREPEYRNDCTIRSYRVGFLPAEALAADLAAEGAPLLADALGFHAEVVLRLAADVLAPPDERDLWPVYEALELGDDTGEAEPMRDLLRHTFNAYPTGLAHRAVALRRTADDLATSRGARAALLARVRAPLARRIGEADPSEHAPQAAAWLSGFDGTAVVSRPDLGRLYAAAGSPDGLDPSALYTLASARWGAPRKVRGNYVYRPALALARE